MEERRTTGFRLAGGECLRLAVDAGTAVLVLDGRVLLQPPPAWLGDRVLTGRLALDAESLQVVECSGWIVLEAVAAAELLLLTPAALPWWRRIARGVDRLLAEAGAA